MKDEAFDMAIVGAGILGLATAYALIQQQPGLRLVVLEKEEAIATHQTGHNSGVIHSGIYYKPGSLKAQLCTAGARSMEAFCTQHAIPFQRIGKVIVATQPDELPRLEALFERGLANGVPGIRKISSQELHEIEPHGVGLAAIHCPNTGIVDYKQVAQALRQELEQRQVQVCTGAKVDSIQVATQAGGLSLALASGENIRARFLINCAGLYADVIARAMGLQPQISIVPFRGEYYLIKPQRQALVRGLIYPVPNPALPFLGVHFTRSVHGEVEAGPNAVLAFAREGYTLRTFHSRELFQMLTFPGFRKMARTWWRVGAYEVYRSLSKAAFVKSLQALVPEITGDDIVAGGAGVRAQAVGVDGKLLDDFAFMETAESLHVLNAPSPAATASLQIGAHVAALALARFD